MCTLGTPDIVSDITDENQCWIESNEKIWKVLLGSRKKIANFTDKEKKMSYSFRMMVPALSQGGPYFSFQRIKVGLTPCDDNTAPCRSIFILHLFVRPSFIISSSSYSSLSLNTISRRPMVTVRHFSSPKSIWISLGKLGYCISDYNYCFILLAHVCSNTVSSASLSGSSFFPIQSLP